MKQASRELLSYEETALAILRTDGIRGLVGRGLLTRLMASGVQGMVRSSRTAAARPQRQAGGQAELTGL